MQHELNLIWIDLEMTGLDPATDQIIEIATIVTDAHLTVLAEGPSLAIHQSDEVLNSMNSWCIQQHGQSGLTERVRQSTITMAQAESETLDFLTAWVEKGKSPMCGNSICQDRRFLVKSMPTLEQYFHYRNLDVSTLKELAKRWRPELLSQLTKASSHLALDDIKDSIDELKFYQENFMQSTPPNAS